MLICVDCQRTNAPWAKKCSACGADLHLHSPNTLISDYPGNEPVKHGSKENKGPLDENAADIKTWSPDKEWHSIDEIDGEKVLDNETVEPISVIDPSRTFEIDWGDSRRETEKFDSTPINADSKNRFDEYGYDFEKANKSAWKTTAILLCGVLAILTAGGLAIGYLHSTTAASPQLAGNTIEKNQSNSSKANSMVPPAGVGIKQANQASDVVMTEEVISVTKPMNQEIGQVDASNQNAQIIKSASTHSETPAVKPPVFVMSASEPILAKPEAGKIATAAKKLDQIPTIIQKQASAETPPKSSKPAANKSEQKNTPYPVLVPVPVKTEDARSMPTSLNSSTPSEPSLTVAGSAMQTTSQSTLSRLKEKQSSDCANSAFLGKVFCEERARVNFCSNRWNVHPDCQLNNNKLEP